MKHIIELTEAEVKEALLEYARNAMEGDMRWTDDQVESVTLLDDSPRVLKQGTTTLAQVSVTIKKE